MSKSEGMKRLTKKVSKHCNMYKIGRKNNEDAEQPRH
jgi:hypothetical protein